MLSQCGECGRDKTAVLDLTDALLVAPAFGFLLSSVASSERVGAVPGAIRVKNPDSDVSPQTFSPNAAINNTERAWSAVIAVRGRSCSSESGLQMWLDSASNLVCNVLQFRSEIPHLVADGWESSPPPPLGKIKVTEKCCPQAQPQSSQTTALAV